jgi:hypothetical protein
LALVSPLGDGRGPPFSLSLQRLSVNNAQNKPPMKIDKTKFLASVNNFVASKSYELFQKCYNIDLVKYTEPLQSKSDVFDFAEIQPVHDYAESYFFYWSVKAMMMGKFALQSCVDFTPENRIIEGDFELEYNDSFINVFFGDLTINGNFTNKGLLLVIGNMYVNGSWVDTYMDVSNAAIAGNLIIAGTIFTEGNVSVGGKLETKLAYLSYNQGFATIMDGCFSKILLEFDHGGSAIFGDIQTQYYEYDELRTEAAIKSNPAELLKDVPALFTPEFVEELNKAISEDDKEYYDEDDTERGRWDHFKEILYSYMEKGKPLLQAN